MNRSKHVDRISVMMDNCLRLGLAHENVVLPVTSKLTTSQCGPISNSKQQLKDDKPNGDKPSHSSLLQEAETRVEQSELDNFKTIKPIASQTHNLINDYLIKLTMFLLATIVFSPNLTMRPANCHKHLFQNNNHHHQQQHHHYNQQSQPPGHHEYIMLNQRQALDHLIRGQNHHNHHHHFLHQRQYQSGADRRASSSATGDYGSSNGGSLAGQQNNNNAADPNGNGKLLVCYYTTRSSPPYWPTNDARGYVVPTTEEVVINGNGNGNGNGSPPELRQLSGFLPMLHYEPFSIKQDNSQQQQRQVNNGQDYGVAGNMKNQQQQLVFKSAAVMQPSTNQLATGSASSLNINNSYGGRSGGPDNHNQNSIGHTSGSSGRSYKGSQQYQDMFATDSPFQASTSNYQQYQSLIIGGGGGGDGGQSASNLKGKQTPAYSFIGPDNNNLDANINNNNGRIVNGAATSFIHGSGQQVASASAGATVSVAPSLLLAGNNGNLGFVISNQQRGETGGNGGALASNNGPSQATSVAATTLDNHLERSLLSQQAPISQQQQQQLVFSPSLSRAFIVGGGGGEGGGNSEALDTKSQLFIPSSQHPHQQPNINNNHYSLLQQTTTVSSMPSMLYQQHEQEQHLMQPITPVVQQQQQQKGKSLQVSALNSDQLSPAAAAASNDAAAASSSSAGSSGFSGAVSSAPSVPLSPASTNQVASQVAQSSNSIAPTANSLHQPPSPNIYRNSQLQTPFLPSSGSQQQQQLIVSNGPPQQQHQQQQVAPANAPQQSTTKTNPNHNHNNHHHHHHHHQHHLNSGGTNFSKTPFSPSDNFPQPSSGKSSSLSYPSSANANANHPQFSNGNHQQQQQQQQQVFAGPKTSTVTNSAGSSSSSSAQSAAMLHNQPQLTPTSSVPSPSSSLVSSPLSTMFDVFGAASQYLMRFKPSSLISPASFVFNTINSNHGLGSSGGGEHSLHGGNHALKTSANGSSPSLLSSLANSASNSLIPLPFSASSLVANLQKSSSGSSISSLSSSSSSISANDRSSSSSSSPSGILARFSLQNSNNNQRREDVCGRTIQTPQRRIIGGEGARYGEFPYQVHIKIAKHQCGGALVDKQSIVTAAHCVYHFITRAPVSKLQIVIGAYDIEDEQYQELPPQYFKVNKVKLHPNFRFSASHPDRYDIAILKLDKPVKYTDNVLPVCLPNKDLKFENMVGTVTGFGKTDPSLSNRYGTRLLQKVDVPIIENNECERWHRTRGIDLKIFPEMMCAGYEDGLKDACVGDSGGPLVVKTSTSGTGGSGGGSRWTLAGITSAGFGCAQSRQPGIYHRVSHTVDWILENLD